MLYTTSLSTYFGSPPLSALRPFKEPSTIPVKAFVSPSGQYYVVTVSGVRIDCHNAATARYYVKNGVDAGLAVDEILASLPQQSDAK